MAIARSFRDLIVYRKARETDRNPVSPGRKFPTDEHYAVTDQIRRGSRPAKAMIAEGWGRRRHKAVAVNNFDDAPGEVTENESWLNDAQDAHYVSAAEFNELDSKCVLIGQMIARMNDRADDFCKHPPTRDYRVISRVEKTEPAKEPLSTIEEFFVTTFYFSPITSHN